MRTTAETFLGINERFSPAKFFKSFGHFGNKVGFFMDICNRHGYDACDCRADVNRRRIVCSFCTFFRTGPTREKRGNSHVFRFFQPCLNPSVP